MTAVQMPEKQRVLMVEDNEINGKMALKLLSIAGYDPELAVDGAVALEKITAPDNHYDVILMDCQVSFSLSVLMPDAGHGRTRMHSADTKIGERWRAPGSSCNYCFDSQCGRYDPM
jgi:hypothetical protein